MKKFKYKTVGSLNSTMSQDELNTEGEKGWELITVIVHKISTDKYWNQYIFKKEVVE